MNVPHLLLTGASGSTAGNMLRMGAFRGMEISAVSRSGRIMGGDEKFLNIQADLSLDDPEKFLPRRADILVHGAAMVPKKATSEADYALNPAMAEKLAEYAWNRRLGHVIFISTGSVYGAAELPLESSICEPADAYGRSMRQAEEILKGIKAKVPLTILRLYYPYGFDRHTPADNLVAKLFLRVAQGLPLTVGDTAENARFRPTFMPDLAQFIRWVIASSWTGILNVAGPEAISLPQMLREMGRILGKSPEIGIQPGMSAPADAAIYLLKSLSPGFSWTSFAEGLPKAAKSLNLLLDYGKAE